MTVSWNKGLLNTIKVKCFLLHINSQKRLIPQEEQQSTGYFQCLGCPQTTFDHKMFSYSTCYLNPIHARRWASNYPRQHWIHLPAMMWLWLASETGELCKTLLTDIIEYLGILILAHRLIPIRIFGDSIPTLPCYFLSCYWISFLSFCFSFLFIYGFLTYPFSWNG